MWTGILFWVPIAILFLLSCIIGNALFSPSQSRLFRQLGVFGVPLFIFFVAVSIVFIFTHGTIETSVRFLNDVSTQRATAGRDRFVGTQKETIRRLVRQEIDLIERECLSSGLSEERVQALALDRLRFLRFGVQGEDRFFVLDRNGAFLVGSTDEEKPTSIAPFQPLVSKALASNGEMRYMASHPDSQRVTAKIAYVERFVRWNWVIGAGFFPEDVDAALNNVHSSWNEISARYMSGLRRFFALISLLTGAFAAICGYFVFRIEKTRLLAQNDLAQYHRVLDESLCVIRTDCEGRIVNANDSYLSLSGRSLGAILGKRYDVDWHPDTSRDQLAGMRDCLLHGSDWRGSIKLRSIDGATFFLQTAVAPLRDEKGRPSGFLATAHNVTELFEKRRVLEQFSRTDELTGLGNRQGLLDDYDAAPGAFVALYDIVRFSEINRSFGEPVGDEVLKTVATSLFDGLDRDCERAYRIHADTFAILSIGQPASLFVERCRLRLVRLEAFCCPADSSRPPVSVVTGVATHSSDAFVLAGAALAAAKDDSEGCVVYSEESDADVAGCRNAMEVLRQIRLAIAEDRVGLVFQPIMDLSTRAIGKYECLIRARDEKGKVLVPADFIEIAKKGRLYRRLTLYVIEAAIVAFKESDADFSINFTIEDLLNQETIGFLKTFATSHHVADRLILEIVETEELRDFEDLSPIFAELRAIGIRLAIDDFGSGYSNFSYLIRLNADFIKIDSCLIRNVLTDERSRALVRSIVRFAKESEVKTIAEYVDTAELLEAIAALGIDYAQGYHIGVPSPTIGSGMPMREATL